MYQTINVCSVNITIKWSNSAAAGGLIDSLVAPRSEWEIELQSIEIKSKCDLFVQMYANHSTEITPHS